MKKMIAFICLVLTAASLSACKSKEESQAESIGKRFASELSQAKTSFDNFDQRLKEVEAKKQKEAVEK